MWLGSMRPRSQCVGGMLLVQWCHTHVLNCLKAARGRRRLQLLGTACAPGWKRGSDGETRSSWAMHPPCSSGQQMVNERQGK